MERITLPDGTPVSEEVSLLIRMRLLNRPMTEADLKKLKADLEAKEAHGTLDVEDNEDWVLERLREGVTPKMLQACLAVG